MVGDGSRKVSIPANGATERHLSMVERLRERRFATALVDACAESRPGSDAALADCTLIPVWFAAACARQQADRLDTIFVAVDRATLDRKLAVAGMPVLERSTIVAGLAAVTTPELESTPVATSGENPWPARVRELREWRHWAAPRLAVELGVSASAIYMWETGRANPGPRNAAKLRQLMEAM